MKGRIKRLRLSLGFMEALLRWNERSLEVIDCLPADIHIVAVCPCALDHGTTIDPEGPVCLLVESAQFPEVGEDEVIPELLVGAIIRYRGELSGGFTRGCHTT